MWIFWKILSTHLQLHLYLKCHSNPGFFPIYPPIILKLCSAITRGEMKEKYPVWLGVPYSPWTISQALNTQFGFALSSVFLPSYNSETRGQDIHTLCGHWCTQGLRRSSVHCWQGGAGYEADGRFLLSAHSGQKSWTPPSAPGKVQGRSLAISTLNEANLVFAISSTNYFCKASELSGVSCAYYHLTSCRIFSWKQ